jgi:hypothetical protein
VQCLLFARLPGICVPAVVHSLPPEIVKLDPRHMFMQKRVIQAGPDGMVVPSCGGFGGIGGSLFVVTCNPCGSIHSKGLFMT